MSSSMLAIEAGEHALKKREEQMNFWPKMREKIKIYGWHHLLQRSRGKPVVMIDRKELRQELAFTERVIQSDDWLKTKLGGREEQEEMLRVLKHYYQSLKKTYVKYKDRNKVERAISSPFPARARVCMRMWFWEWKREQNRTREEEPHFIMKILAIHST